MNPEPVEDVDTEVTEEVHTMSFPEAIAEVTIGKRIQRLEWHDSEYAILKDVHIDGKPDGVMDRMLVIHREEKDYLWNISVGDLLAEDFVSF